jgi:hypothetical protein
MAIGFDLIKGNEGGTVQASYWVKRKADGHISPSEVLAMSIGAGISFTAPIIEEAAGDILDIALFQGNAHIKTEPHAALRGHVLLGQRGLGDGRRRDAISGGDKATGHRRGGK